MKFYNNLTNSEKLKITIFSKGHRPKENYNGLCHIARNDKVNKICKIDSLFKEKLDLNKPLLEKKNKIYRSYIIDKVKIFIENFIFLYKSDLVFGHFNIVLRIFLIICGWHGKHVCVPPGKITKASGYFKNHEKLFLRIIKNTFSNKFLRTYILATDNLDKLNLSLSNSYMLSNLLISLYPKHIFINYQLSKKNKKNKKRILFAPTERAQGYESPISLFLKSKKNLEKILNYEYEIYYSQHIHDANCNSKITNDIKKFDGSWAEISILVTDYSSIGADFLISGGSNLIYYIKDQNIFCKSQGIGPFFNDEVKKGIRVEDEDKLIKVVLDLYKKEDKFVSRFNENKIQNYFKNINDQTKLKDFKKF